MPAISADNTTRQRFRSSSAPPFAAPTTTTPPPSPHPPQRLHPWPSPRPPHPHGAIRGGSVLPDREAEQSYIFFSFIGPQSCVRMRFVKLHTRSCGCFTRLVDQYTKQIIIVLGVKPVAGIKSQTDRFNAAHHVHSNIQSNLNCRGYVVSKAKKKKKGTLCIQIPDYTFIPSPTWYI